jgi:predicted AAA+ superfamily ATPase
MWIDRRIGSRLARLARQRPALVLTGARQVGKTSLLRRSFPRHAFASLDIPSIAAQAEHDPEGFLRDFPPPVLIDEVQYAPLVFRHLKLQIDRARSSRGRFILTGSQKFHLMKEISESMAGRVAVLELEALSFHEITGAFPRCPLVDVVLRGGYPELWAEPDLDATEFFASYLATYLERDVRSLLRVGSLRDFERFVRACALRSGGLLNKAELARDVGISPPTANEWLSVLQASNKVFLLEPWFSNRTRSLVKSPKLYWCDTGFLCFLIGIRTAEDLTRSPMVGAIWESFVCGELRKRLAFAGLDPAFYFWRDRAREVDFVLHRGGRFELFEAKWPPEPSAKDGAGLRNVAEQLGPSKVIATSILSRTERSFPLDGRVRVLSCRDAWFSGDQPEVEQ